MPPPFKICIFLPRAQLAGEELTALVDHYHGLLLSSLWGNGRRSSSDSQRFAVEHYSLVELQAPTFLPVRMLEAPSSTSDLVSSVLSKPPAAAARTQRGLIEIELGGGRKVRVGSDVSQAALRA